MSKQRAVRRQARLAEAARRDTAARERAAREAARRRRRQRRRVALRSVLPWRPGQRWSRRTRAQRATVAATVAGLLALTYLVTDSWRMVLAMGLLLAVVTPAAVTFAWGRGTR